MESWLHNAALGRTWLGDPRISEIVAEALHHRAGKKYRLAGVNHAFSRATYREARQQVLARAGAFWEHESFDQYIRDVAEWTRIVNYVLANPVKAGLART